MSLRREIKTSQDMTKWQVSKAFKHYTDFILSMSAAVKGIKISDVNKDIGETNRLLVVQLTQMESWIQDIPPEAQRLRYGNPSFVKWHDRLKMECYKLVSAIAAEGVRMEKLTPEAVHEMCGYFGDSFGSPVRIDYGTGHEMNFAIFLMILCNLGVIQPRELCATVLVVFERYLKLVRNLQVVYNLEPAGSHGVWGLDDHQFLPFLWGSAQFLGKEVIEPSRFPEASCYEREASEYIFMSAVQFIGKVKSGPFFEHSNQLWNISSIDTWSKIHKGLIRMYHGEVLSKFPIVQHLQFGKLFSFDHV